jgi:hypothetical protein
MALPIDDGEVMRDTKKAKSASAADCDDRKGFFYSFNTKVKPRRLRRRLERLVGLDELQLAHQPIEAHFEWHCKTLH